MQLTIYSADTAPDSSKAILDGIAADLGFVPSMAGTAAGSPALLSAFDGLRRALGSGELDPADREVAGLAVGVVVDNHYGVAFHSTVLGSLGVDDTEIDRMRACEPSLMPSSPPFTSSPAASCSTVARSTRMRSRARLPPA